MAIVSSVVATGRAMKGAERFRAPRHSAGVAAIAASGSAAGPEAARRSVDREVDDGRGEQGQQLADQQAADDADAQRLAQLRSGSLPEQSGSAPSSAAIVVIRIGRKRNRHA